MYKFYILFLSFFLLASCNTNEQISENISEKTIINITPTASIQVENKNEINGIQLEINTQIIQNENIESIISFANKENEQFIRSHKEKIIQNFPEFKENPTIEYATENIFVQNSIKYFLLNDVYNPNIPENKKINQEQTKLTTGIIQNYNQNYTGSLWDLPLASLYCDTCQTIGLPLETITFAEKSRDIPENFFIMYRESHGESGLLNISNSTHDNTYTKIPESIVYDIGAMADIFEIFNTKPNPNNSFNIKINLPTTHEISDIIYENWDEKISLKDSMSVFNYPEENNNVVQYSIDLIKNEKIIQNSTGKITIFISEK